MQNTQNFNLISFKLCPFVQRSVITLLKKNIPFDITYIDLENKPEWFLNISPFGKVPVLKVNDHDVLFESAVINDYIDEVTPPRISPSDPLAKAKNKAWIEFGSNLIMLQYKWSMAMLDGHYEELAEKITSELAKVNPHIKGPYFNGDQFSLVDAAYAPFFMRLALINTNNAVDLSGLDNVAAWGETLLNDEAVKNSVVPEFNQLFLAYIEQKNPSFIGKLNQILA